MRYTVNMLSLKAHPALLVVDMQNGFCHTSGTFAKLGMDVSNMDAVIPSIARLVALFHSQKLPVIFTRLGFNEDYSDAGIMLEQRFSAIKDTKGFVRGTWDAEVVDGLKPSGGETGADKKVVVIDKTRNTAFHGTGLAERLRGMGIDQLIICGVGTNVCVESTVRDAMTNDFWVVVPTDGTATLTKEMHEASLSGMSWFGELASVDEVVDALGSIGAVSNNAGE